MSELKKDTAVENTAEVKTEKTDKKPEKSKKQDKPQKAKKEKKSGGLKSFLKSRKARHGSVAIAVVAIVIALVVVLNIVVSLLVDRFPNLVLDFTKNQSFELESDTVEYVSHIDKDITITVLTTEEKFEASGTYYIQANKLLEKMESESNGKIKLKYIDLASNPSIPQKYSDADWTQSNKNMMIVECGDQYKVLTIDDCFEYDQSYYSNYGSYYVTASLVEQGVVTAILNVTTENKVTVDMITGNQEQDYDSIKSLLQNNAYQVNEISLATGDLDEEAELAILYAPSVDLDEGAIEKLSKWLDNSGKNGRNLIYIPTENQVDTPNLDGLMNEWGMQVNEGYVYETGNRLVSSSSPYIFTVDYADYYQDGLKNPNIPIVTLYSKDITIKDTSIAHPLLTTSTSSGIYPPDADENWKAEDGLKNEALNVAAEGVKTNTDKKSSKVIVFGSYSMFSSEILSYNSFNNSAYFMNVINTVADRDDAGITIEGKSMESAELGITDVGTRSVLFTVFVIAVPLLVLVTGLVMWLRRRNK